MGELIGPKPEGLYFQDGSPLNKLTSVLALKEIVAEMDDPLVGVPGVLTFEEAEAIVDRQEHVFGRPYIGQWVDNFLPGLTKESGRVQDIESLYQIGKVGLRVNKDTLRGYLSQLGYDYSGDFTESIFYQLPADTLNPPNLHSHPTHFSTVSTSEGTWIDWESAYGTHYSFIHSPDGSIYLPEYENGALSHDYLLISSIKRLGVLHPAITGKFVKRVEGLKASIIEWVVFYDETDLVFRPVQLCALPVTSNPKVELGEMYPEIRTIRVIDMELDRLQGKDSLGVRDKRVNPELFNEHIGDLVTEEPYVLQVKNPAGKVEFPLSINYRNIVGLSGELMNAPLSHGYFRLIQVVWAHNGTVYLGFKKWSG